MEDVRNRTGQVLPVWNECLMTKYTEETRIPPGRVTDSDVCVSVCTSKKVHE